MGHGGGQGGGQGGGHGLGHGGGQGLGHGGRGGQGRLWLEHFSFARIRIPPENNGTHEYCMKEILTWCSKANEPPVPRPYGLLVLLCKQTISMETIFLSQRLIDIPMIKEKCK